MIDFYQQTPEAQVEKLILLGQKALHHWTSEEAEISLIKYRENAVFKVELASGQRYALRMHRPGYHSDAALKAELQWMDALNQYGIAVPEVIPASNGHFLIVESHPDIPEPRQIDLFAWIEGEQLGSEEEGLGKDVESVHDIYFQVGQIAAGLHNQTSQWRAPEGFERHAWDDEGLVGEEPFWGRFWELELLTSEQKALLVEARKAVQQQLAEYDRSSQRYGLIHADFVLENLMTEGDKVRLIDFDDAGYGWHMFELATALYFIQEEPAYETAKQALIEGYRSTRPLADSDLEKLELFLAARSFTYLGWIRSRQETETARELAPDLIRRACKQAKQFLAYCA